MDGTDLAATSTEHLDVRYADLDLRSEVEIVLLLAADQQGAVQAVVEAAPEIALAAQAIAERLGRGGRLFYAGAGTSGRLAQLDAYELFPAFAFPPERTVTLLAGADLPTLAEREAAEDDEEAGRRDLLVHAPTADDVLLGVTASGKTAYTLGAVRAARMHRALTVAIVNNADGTLLTEAEHSILLSTGSEVIAGNTRLKAGTAQKIALNALSTTVMVRLGKVYGNLMVDVQASNDKLRQRAIRLVVAATGASVQGAGAALLACGWDVKTALLMVQHHTTPQGARALLEQHGTLRAALGAQRHA